MKENTAASHEFWELDALAGRTAADHSRKMRSNEVQDDKH